MIIQNAFGEVVDGGDGFKGGQLHVRPDQIRAEDDAQIVCVHFVQIALIDHFNEKLHDELEKLWEEREESISLLDSKRTSQTK